MAGLGTAFDDPELDRVDRVSRAPNARSVPLRQGSLGSASPTPPAGFDNPALDPVTGALKTNATPWVGTQTQVDDSVASHVAKLVGQDSKLNQMAKTEGLKAANSRGLLNSSFAVGAAQDAVLKNALPIAAQDASQAFQKNTAAKAFEYGMTAQDYQNTFTSGERVGTQGFAATQADLDRQLETNLQAGKITSDEKLEFAKIASNEGIQAASMALQERLFDKNVTFQMEQNGLDRASAENIVNLQLAADLVKTNLSIGSQERIAKMGLSVDQQQLVGTLMLGVEQVYNDKYNTIMNNTSLSATDRGIQLKAIANVRDVGLNLIEQIVDVDLKWN